MNIVSVHRLPSAWTTILGQHGKLIRYLVGFFGWVVAVPLYGDSMAVWAAQRGTSIVPLANAFLIAHAISLVVSGMNLDKRPHQFLTILRFTPICNGLLLLVLVLGIPPQTWPFLFAGMGIVSGIGMTAWGRWYAITVEGKWLGQTFAFAAAGVAVLHGAFGILVKHVPAQSVLLLTLLPLVWALLEVRTMRTTTCTTSPHPTVHMPPLSKRIQAGLRFGLFICFFSVVAGLSDRFFVATPLSPFIQDFLRMGPYIIGVLLSGLVSDLRGMQWAMVGGAGFLAASFLIGAWSDAPGLALIGLFCNGLAFGLLEPAPWLLLASCCTQDSAGRWFGFGLNLNVIPIFIGSVIAIPLGQMTTSRLGLLASFFVLLAILFLYGAGDPLASLRKLQRFAQTTQARATSSEGNSVVLDQFERSFGESLSEREKEIGKLAIAGKSNQEIAELLFISENTVKYHLKNVFRKTQSTNRNDLYRKVVQDVHG